MAGPGAVGRLRGDAVWQTPPMWNGRVTALQRLAAIAYGVVAISGCAGTSTTPEQRLQDALDDVVGSDARVPGAVLVARSPDLDFRGVAGARSLDEGAPAMRVDDLFRAASATKTFVAAAVIVRSEAGALSLDDPLRMRLSAESLLALERGGYDPDAMTVRQLLAHTAGIYDYTETDTFYATIDADPSHRWTRAEQLALAMDDGWVLNEPGDAYAYGDTHYILAGEVLERSTGAGLAEALRSTLRFDAIGLSSTWLESLEDPPAADAFERLSHPYDGDVDTRDWDPSWDLYGGGGLATSADDLARFIDALFDGELLGDAALDEMLTVSDVSEGAFFGIDGALGIARFYLDDGSACWAGYGYFGTAMVRCPALDLTYACTLNQSEPRDADAIDNAVLSE